METREIIPLTFMHLKTICTQYLVPSLKELVEIKASRISRESWISIKLAVYEEIICNKLQNNDLQK